MVNALPLRIFLASPGDVASERAAVQAVVNEYNNRSAGDGGVKFEVIGWDRVRGTARRPQEAINELIMESHFMVVLFKRSWGSAPGSPWGYTSGTEEELFTGLLELGQADQPMRDVWVAFVDDTSPADQIQDLKNEMSSQHALMYESVGNLRDFKDKFSAVLRNWEDLAGTKVARHIDLLPSSGRDVLRAANKRIRGEDLVELGEVDPGRTALEEAAALGGPEEHLALSKFQARHGDLVAAHASAQRAIDYFTSSEASLHSPLAAKAFAAQAAVLRRQGEDFAAIGRLEKALTLLHEGQAYARDVRCRILDDLGLANMAIGEIPTARDWFERALRERTAASDNLGVCQSKVNLARLEVAAGDLATAAQYADEVVETLRRTPPTSLRANAEALAAQVRLRIGEPSQAIPFAERSLSLNKQLANRNGEAKALLVLAQCCRADNRTEEARRHAQACLELNTDMKNDSGAQRAQWLLSQL